MRVLPGILALVALNSVGVTGEQEWWQTMSLYQIYPRSYKDGDGDGIGDFKGISSNLDHLKDSNIDASWLSPFYRSPMIDFGYDISNFIDVDPIFGTLEDFDNYVKQSHDLGVKVIVDFVPNHSSDKHEWFQKSVKNIQPYSDYYIWKNGSVGKNDTIAPPNNWVSVFGGSAWEWNEERKAFYLHQFKAQQPDLNYLNADVVEEMKNTLRFWMKRGVDGFRMDAVPYIFEDERFLDEPLSGVTNDPNLNEYLDHIYTKDQQKTYEMVQQWRNVLDDYQKIDGVTRVMMMEAYANHEKTMKYYDYGAHFPFNFGFITDVNRSSSAADYKNLVDNWMSSMPKGATPNWVAGNHDNARVATRFGPQIAQSIIAMTLLLPGVGVTYYGDEIGMQNTEISWEDTIDPAGCDAGKDRFESLSRDPERTPFQWDNSTSAGFSTNPKTWLPVNPDYLTRNLAAEQTASESFYKLYLTMSSLRKSPAIRKGKLITRLLNSNVFAFSRENKDDAIYVLLNFADEQQKVDLSAFDGAPAELIIYCSSLSSNLNAGDKVNSASLQIPAEGFVIYVPSKNPLYVSADVIKFQLIAFTYDYE